MPRTLPLTLWLGGVYVHVRVFTILLNEDHWASTHQVSWYFSHREKQNIIRSPLFFLEVGTYKTHQSGYLSKLGSEQLQWIYSHHHHFIRIRKSSDKPICLFMSKNKTRNKKAKLVPCLARTTEEA